VRDMDGLVSNREPDVGFEISWQIFVNLITLNAPTNTNVKGRIGPPKVGGVIRDKTKAYKGTSSKNVLCGGKEVLYALSWMGKTPV